MKALFCCLLMGSLAAGVHSQPWSAATAHTVAPGTLDAGLFQPVRYGIGPLIELSSSAAGLLSPGFSLKIGWRDIGEWRLATQHGINYPTPLLRLLSREGIGGMLPSDSSVPHLLSFRNRILATRAVLPGHWITVDAGIRWAVRFGRRDMVTLDLPLFYPRTASYHGNPVLQFGGHVDGALTRSWGYAIGLDVLYITGASHMALEQSGMVIAGTTRRFQPFAGYRWIRGEYPFGVQRHLVPLAGFRWILKRP